jgi:alpha-L-fucosidase
VTFVRTGCSPKPLHSGRGSSRVSKSRLLIVMGILGSMLGPCSGCSSSVNALYRDGAAGGNKAAASGGAAGNSAVTPTNQICPELLGGPPGVQPLANPNQIAYQRTELTAYIHFGMATYDGTEYGDASKDTPLLFDPTNLDAAQWVGTLKAAGFRQVTLVAKHMTGFCLWPSAFTDYSVKNSPWKNGQGDVVREFTDAMHLAGMRVGLYLSPWDGTYPSTSTSYETYFRNQVTELLTQYGQVHEILWDGYNAPTSLDWKGIAQLAHQLQPEVLVWMGREIATTGAELRYLGNLNAKANRATSNIEDVPNGGPSNVWYPAEAPVPDRNSNWFWHPNGTVISLASLQSIYFTSVGMNTTLNLNVPPATTGQFDTPDLNLLQEFGTWHSQLYRTNLVRGQPATADSTWANEGFEAAQAVDDDICTYWAAAGGRTSARLEVTPAQPFTFTVISIREPIELGERTTGYHVELKQNGAWNQAPSDDSGSRIQGTVIGQRQLWRLGYTTAEAIALVIDSAKDVPAIAEFSAY